MHIKDHNDAMKFFRTYDNVASKGKWKEFVDEMEFESMIQKPRATAQEPRIGLKPGGIVEPGVVNYAKVELTSSMKKNIAEFEKFEGKGAYEKAKDWLRKDIRDGNWTGTGSGGANIRPTKEIIELTERTKGGDLKIKRWISNPTEENFQILRLTAKTRATYENQMYTTKEKYVAFRKMRRVQEKKWALTDKGLAEKAKIQSTQGHWPATDSKERVWRDIRRASLKKGSRFQLVTEVPKAVISKNGIKYIPWHNVYKGAVFYDTQTEKKITLEGLEKYMDKHIGKNTYKNALAKYDVKKELESIKMMYKGEKTTVGELLRRNILSEKEMAANRGFSAIEVNHIGTADEFWKTEVTGRTANRKLVPLKSRLTKKLALATSEADKAKVIKEFIKEIEKLPGGITQLFAGEVRGTVPTSKSVLEALGTEASVKGKNWNQVIQSAKVKTLAKSLQFAGIDINKICSGQLAKAGGGRIGFAEKVCGMKYAEQNEDAFMKKAANHPEAAKLFRSGNIAKHLMKAKNWARTNLGPAGLIGSELLIMGLGTAYEMSQGKGWKEALDAWTGLGGHFGQAEERLREIGEEQGWGKQDIHDAMKIGQLMDISTKYEDKLRKLEGIQEKQDIGGTARYKADPKERWTDRPRGYTEGQYQDPKELRDLKAEVPELAKKGESLYKSLMNFPTSTELYNELQNRKALEELNVRRKRQHNLFENYYGLGVFEEKPFYDLEYQKNPFEKPIPRWQPYASGGIASLKKKR